MFVPKVPGTGERELSICDELLCPYEGHTGKCVFKAIESGDFYKPDSLFPNCWLNARGKLGFSACRTRQSVLALIEAFFLVTDMGYAMWFYMKKTPCAVTMCDEKALMSEWAGFVTQPLCVSGYLDWPTETEETRLTLAAVWLHAPLVKEMVEATVAIMKTISGFGKGSVGQRLLDDLAVATRAESELRGVCVLTPDFESIKHWAKFVTLSDMIEEMRVKDDAERRGTSFAPEEASDASSPLSAYDGDSSDPDSSSDED